MNHPGDRIHKKSFIETIIKQRYLILMVLPFLIWVIIFKYLPLWGWTMAFQDYRPRAGMGVFDYPFVGLKHFIALFKDPMFYNVMRNTLAMSFMQLILGFPLPILFAILLNYRFFHHFSCIPAALSSDLRLF